jgi:hypothetical protein
MGYDDIVEHFSKEGLDKNKVQACFNTAHFAFYKKYPDKLIFTAEELKQRLNISS